MEELLEQWMNAKEMERSATEFRREVEDKLVKQLNINQFVEGTETKNILRYKIKVVKRFNTKINSDLLQELAAEAGLTDHLSILFRWKPEVNASVWHSASPEITRPLLGAITTEPGRPSFSITTITKE